MIQRILVFVLVSPLLSWSVVGLCPAPRPAFPVPSIRREAPEIKAATSKLHKALQELGMHLNDDTAFSVHVSTSETDLFSYHHVLGEEQELWNGHLLHYRIGALTKIATALAIEQAVVHDRMLEIDEPIVRYVPELKDSTGPHSWGNVSIRSIVNFDINMPIERENY